MRKVSFLVSFVVSLILVTAPAFGQFFNMSRGQIVYVPANHNYISPLTNDWSVRTRLIIRNVDLHHQITIDSIELYDPDGILAEEFETPVDLDRLNSKTFGVTKDPLPALEGRPGFIVMWTANTLVQAPIIESGTAIIYLPIGSPPSFQGVSFSQGRVLREIWW